jgi:hypothetical protein
MRRHWSIPGYLTKFGNSLQRPPFPSLAVAVLATLLLITLSVILDVDAPAKVLLVLAPLKWKATLSFILIFFAGAAAGILCYGVGQSGWKETASCFWVPIRRTGFLLAVIGFSLLALLIWIASAWVSSETKKHYLSLHDPGAIFAAFMGIVTIVGFAFTLHDLREMRRRITTFPDLIDRLTVMLQKANWAKDVVRFLAYTPALGFIALEDHEFRRFFNGLHDRGDGEMPPIDMVCLSKKCLEEWHDLFIGRGTRRKRFDDAPRGTAPSPQKTTRLGEVDRNLARAATRKGEFIVSDITRQAQDACEEPRIKRLPFEFLPGYYFFLSSDRAIVAAPLQLPFPKGAPKRVQQSRGTVQMLGFETNDRAVIRDLSDLYDSYKKLPSSYIAEHSEEVDADQFEAWCTNQTSSAIESVILQFNVARGACTPPLENEELQTLYEDYKDYLAPQKLNRTKLEVILRVSLKEEAADS